MLVALVQASVACGDSLNGPGAGTETGNPPLLDKDGVSLEARADGPSLIVGRPGAVTPASGVVVSAVELRTGEVFRAEVRADGSFEIEVPADGIYYVMIGENVDRVQVLLAAGRDPDSVVVLGDASVEAAVAESGLTCFYQKLGAEGAVTSLLSESERSCREDADCALVSADNPCARACGHSALSASAREAFESSVAALTESVCPAYADGECSMQPLSCGEQAGEDVARCRAGTCVVENSLLEDVCGGPQVALQWSKYPAGSEPESAPQYSFAGLAYGTFQRSDAAGTQCFGELARCDGSGQEQDEVRIRRAAAHPDVQAVLNGGDVVFAAGADSMRMRIDVGYSANFVRMDLPLCATCQVPEGVLALAELLDALGEGEDWQSCNRSQ